MKLKLFKSDGTESGEHEVTNFPVLEEGKGIDALRQVILAVRANKRQGNASTKLRSEVAGSGKKIFRQKGLGVGRQGDKRSPTEEVVELCLDPAHAHTHKSLIRRFGN